LPTPADARVVRIISETCAVLARAVSHQTGEGTIDRVTTNGVRECFAGVGAMLVQAMEDAAGEVALGVLVEDAGVTLILIAALGRIATL
jgi:hypothetical protein